MANHLYVQLLGHQSLSVSIPADFAAVGNGVKLYRLLPYRGNIQIFTVISASNTHDFIPKPTVTRVLNYTHNQSRLLNLRPAASIPLGQHLHN